MTDATPRLDPRALRLECLRLAKTYGGRDQDVLARAELFNGFVMGVPSDADRMRAIARDVVVNMLGAISVDEARALSDQASRAINSGPAA